MERFQFQYINNIVNYRQVGDFNQYQFTSFIRFQFRGEILRFFSPNFTKQKTLNLKEMWGIRANYS